MNEDFMVEKQLPGMNRSQIFTCVKSCGGLLFLPLSEED